jgi:hypothetical protein
MPTLFACRYIDRPSIWIGSEICAIERSYSIEFGES